MPVTFLVSAVLEDIRVRCDLPTYSTTTPVTSAAILSMVTGSALSLSGLVRSAYGADFFETSADLSTQSGLAYVSLPENCSSVRRLVWVRGADDFVKIERAAQDDTNAWSGGWSNSTPVYRLRSGNVALFPTPLATYTIRLTYDTGIIIAATTDTISAEAGWREWLALDVCRKIRQRQQKDASDFVFSQQEQEHLIRSLVPRDRGGITQIRDVDDIPTRARPWDR